MSDTKEKLEAMFKKNTVLINENEELKKDIQMLFDMVNDPSRVDERELQRIGEMYNLYFL